MPVYPRPCGGAVVHRVWHVWAEAASGEGLSPPVRGSFRTWWGCTSTPGYAAVYPRPCGGASVQTLVFRTPPGLSAEEGPCGTDALRATAPRSLFVASVYPRLVRGSPGALAVHPDRRDLQAPATEVLKPCGGSRLRCRPRDQEPDPRSSWSIPAQGAGERVFLHFTPTSRRG